MHPKNPRTAIVMSKGNRISLRLLAKHAAPLVLLLTVHSIVVSGFHHHSNLQTSIVEQGTHLDSRDTDKHGGSPSGSGDASCVSCQLQRTFASEVRTPTILGIIPTEPVKRLLLAALPALGRPAMVLSNRAPPAA